MPVVVLPMKGLPTVVAPPVCVSVPVPTLPTLRLLPATIVPPLDVRLAVLSTPAAITNSPTVWIRPADGSVSETLSEVPAAMSNRGPMTVPLTISNEPELNWIRPRVPSVGQSVAPGVPPSSIVSTPPSRTYDPSEVAPSPTSRPPAVTEPAVWLYRP